MHHAFKNDAGRIAVGDRTPFRIIGIQSLGWTHWAKQITFGCVWKCSMLIFVKIRYETTTPSVICRNLTFHCENVLSPCVIHTRIWHVSKDLQSKNLTMLESDTSPDVKTSETRCLKPGAIASRSEATIAACWPYRQAGSMPAVRD